MFVWMPKLRLLLNNCSIVATIYSFPFIADFIFCLFFCLFLLNCFGAGENNLSGTLPRRPSCGWNSKQTEHENQGDEQLPTLSKSCELWPRRLLLVVLLPESPRIHSRVRTPYRVKIRGRHLPNPQSN